MNIHQQQNQEEEQSSEEVHTNRHHKIQYGQKQQKEGEKKTIEIKMKDTHPSSDCNCSFSTPNEEGQKHDKMSSFAIETNERRQKEQEESIVNHEEEEGSEAPQPAIVATTVECDKITTDLSSNIGSSGGDSADANKLTATIIHTATMKGEDVAVPGHSLSVPRTPCVSGSRKRRYEGDAGEEGNKSDDIIITATTTTTFSNSSSSSSSSTSVTSPSESPRFSSDRGTLADEKKEEPKSGINSTSADVLYHERTLVGTGTCTVRESRVEGCATTVPPVSCEQPNENNTRAEEKSRNDNSTSGEEQGADDSALLTGTNLPSWFPQTRPRTTHPTTSPAEYSSSASAADLPRVRYNNPTLSLSIPANDSCRPPPPFLLGPTRPFFIGSDNATTTSSHFFGGTTPTSSDNGGESIGGDHHSRRTRTGGGPPPSVSRIMSIIDEAIAVIESAESDDEDEDGVGFDRSWY